LLNTDLNKGRSDLKIQECAAKNIDMIISSNYLTKGKYDGLLVDNWIPNLKKIVEDGYQSRITFPDTFQFYVDKRLEIFKNVMYRPVSVTYNDLYSVKYLKEQDVEYKEYFNNVKTIAEKSYLFEYNAILNIVPKATGKYIGIFSHKFPHKTGYYKKFVEKQLNQSETDIVVFCYPLKDYLNYSEFQHPGLLQRLQLVCDELGMKMECDVGIYSNFFAAKEEVYKEYIEVLKKAINFMDKNPHLFFQDANYNAGLDPTELKRYTELDYYTYHTFVLERLISIWIKHKGLTYSYGS